MHRLRSRTCERMTTARSCGGFSGAHDQRTRSVRPSSTNPERWMHQSQRRSRSSAVSGRRVEDSRWIGRGRRSSQNRPVVSSGAPSSAASHTSVSTPCSGLRSSGPVPRRNVGNDVRTPGVSAQPGASHARRSGRAAAARPTSGRGLPAAFGPRVRDGAAITVGSAVEGGGDRERLGVHASGGHPEHARPRPGTQQRQQQTGHQERPDHPAGHGAFDATVAIGPVTRIRAGS